MENYTGGLGEEVTNGDVHIDHPSSSSSRESSLSCSWTQGDECHSWPSSIHHIFVLCSLLGATKKSLRSFFSRHSLHTLSSLSTWSFFVRSLAVTTLFLSLTLTISQIPSLLSGLDVPLPHPFHHHTPGHRDNSSSLTLLDIPSVTSPSRDSTTVEPDLQSFRPQSNDQSFSSSLTNPFTMAGLKNIILAASLLAPLTMAAPRLDVRAMYTHTDTEIVWVTVEETTTVWLDAASATPAPVAATTSSSSSSTISTIPVAVASTTTSAAAVFAQTSYSPSTMATVAAVSSPAYSPDATAWSSSAAPVASSSSSAAASPAASASSVNVQAKDIAASDSASCEGQGAACEGDVTHWDGGKFCL